MEAAIERQAEETRALNTQVERVTALRRALPAKRGMLRRWRELLRNAPDIKGVLKILVEDLADLRVDLSSFAPFSPRGAGRRGQEETEGGLRRERNQITFDAGYPEVVELLGRWRDLPFHLRFDRIQLSPKKTRAGGRIGVALYYSVVQEPASAEESES